MQIFLLRGKNSCGLPDKPFPPSPSTTEFTRNLPLINKPNTVACMHAKNLLN